MPIDYSQIRNIGATGAQAYSEGQRNRLIDREVEKEDATNALLAEMTMPGATPEVQNALLQKLTAQNPQAAQNYLVTQQTQRDMDWQQQIRTAQEGIGKSRAIRASSNPIAMMEYLDPEGGLRQMGADMGLDMSDPEDVDELMGLVEARYSMMAGTANEGRTSAAIGDMEALGYPMTPEGFAKYNEDRGAQGLDMFDAVQTQLAIRALELQNEDRERAAEAARTQAEQQRTTQQQSIVRNIEQNRQAVDLTQKLEGTMLESGMLMSDARRGLASIAATVGGLAGRDTSELQQQIADFDSQRKILQDQVNARIASGDYGVSATQLQSLERSLASPNISPQAIIRIQGQLAQMDLDRADALELEIPNREEYERLAKEWKDYSPVSVSNIKRMSLTQLEDLSMDELGEEQREAAADRWDELNAAQ